MEEREEKEGESAGGMSHLSEQEGGKETLVNESGERGESLEDGKGERKDESKEEIKEESKENQPDQKEEEKSQSKNEGKADGHGDLKDSNDEGNEKRESKGEKRELGRSPLQKIGNWTKSFRKV